MLLFSLPAPYMPDLSLLGRRDPGKKIDPLILALEFGSFSNHHGTPALHLDSCPEMGIRDFIKGLCVHLLGTDQLHLLDLFKDGTVPFLLHDLGGCCRLRRWKGSIRGSEGLKSDIKIEGDEEGDEHD